MQTPVSSTAASSVTTVHPLTAKDQAVMSQVRAMSAPNKGRLRGIAARAPFDDIIGHTAAPTGVNFRPDTVGGLAGWWTEPANAEPRAAILYLHGGWFSWGTAKAYRNLVGHIAKSAGVAGFIPDYRLAPEHPFPAGPDDARAAYRGLVERGFRAIAVVGDSAGGNLALGLVARIAAEKAARAVLPVAAVALSPVTDLALSGESWESRAQADPYFVRDQGEEQAGVYLAGGDPTDPLASPLYGRLVGLPPIRLHVGDDEVLLDDSVRYAALAAAAGVDVRLGVWRGMAHGFLGSVGALDAADSALEAIGGFLTRQFAGSSAPG
jgi:monoterpene epsilon-lactone hydrolase